MRRKGMIVLAAFAGISFAQIGSATAATVGNWPRLWESGGLPNLVTIGAVGADWVVSDAGSEPVRILDPVCARVEPNGARCPRGTVTWAQAWLNGGDRLRKWPHPPGTHLYVWVQGPRPVRVDVRDGQSDEVSCANDADAHVRADRLDRVWGGCAYLNGRRWQKAVVIDQPAGSLDVLGHTLAWTSGARLRLRRGSHTVTYRPLGGRPVSQVALGRYEGRRVALVAGCRTAPCRDWHAVDLRSGTTRALPDLAQRNCRVHAVAAWGRALTSLQECRRPRTILVSRRIGGRAVPLLRRKSWWNDSTWPARINVRRDVVIAFDEGRTWLVRTGRRACHALIDYDYAMADMWSTIGQPIVDGSRVLWTQDLGGISGGVPYARAWTVIAAMGSGCAIPDAPRRYAVVRGLAQAAVVTGRRLVLLEGGWGRATRLTEQRLATITGPLSYYP
jgi:hypothetical protein